VQNKTNTAGFFFGRKPAQRCLQAMEKLPSLAAAVPASLARLLLSATGAVQSRFAKAAKVQF